MIQCKVCNGSHRSNVSGPYKWCHNPENPMYIAKVMANHRYHSGGNGGHKHCPLCPNKWVHEQQQLFLRPIEDTTPSISDSICGCQG